jgi:hypothetical protein
MSFTEVFEETRNDLRRFYRELDRLSEISTSSDEDLTDEIVDFRTPSDLRIYDWIKLKLYNIFSYIRFLRG